jgi:DNA-binding response OmpR family regulator
VRSRLTEFVGPAGQLAQCEQALLDSVTALEAAYKSAREAFRDLLQRSEESAHGGAALRGGSKDANGTEHLIEPDTLPQNAKRRTALKRETGGKYLLGSRRLTLTEAECTIMDLLWDNKPHPVNRAAIYDKFHTNGSSAKASTIDVHICNIRNKMRLVSGGEEFIIMKRGFGWLLTN